MPRSYFESNSTDNFRIKILICQMSHKAQKDQNLADINWSLNSGLFVTARYSTVFRGYQYLQLLEQASVCVLSYDGTNYFYKYHL